MEPIVFKCDAGKLEFDGERIWFTAPDGVTRELSPHELLAALRAEERRRASAGTDGTTGET